MAGSSLDSGNEQSTLQKKRFAGSADSERGSINSEVSGGGKAGFALIRGSERHLPNQMKGETLTWGKGQHRAFTGKAANFVAKTNGSVVCIHAGTLGRVGKKPQRDRA